MSILLWILFGAFIGWIASMIMGTNENQGAIGNIVVGIIGAMIGGFIIEFLGGDGITGINLSSMLVALFGSVILLFGYQSATSH